VVWVLSNEEISALLCQHLIQTNDAQLCFDLRAAWNASGPLLLRLSTLEFIASVYESADHLIGSGNKSVRFELICISATAMLKFIFLRSRCRNSIRNSAHRLLCLSPDRLCVLAKKFGQRRR
jgi:hypothetical protein